MLRRRCRLHHFERPDQRAARPPGRTRGARRGARSNRTSARTRIPTWRSNRRPNQALGPRNASLNSLPRLAADPAGGIYLAFRSLDGPFNARSPVGSVWFEHVVYFDGHNWVGPVFLPRTDGLLDNRPALLALEAGHLLAVSAMDHRQSIPRRSGVRRRPHQQRSLFRRPAPRRLVAAAAKPELMRCTKEIPRLPDPAPSKPNATRSPPSATTGSKPADKQLRILRGDFHRHTEYSVDGTRDGSLADAYRYMIDAASLDWGGCCDNENGGGHEYFWWTQQKTDR